MMYIIREDKRDMLSEHIEKALKHMGKAMQCVEDFESEGGSELGERYGYRIGRYGNRGGYRGGYREDWPDYDEIGERRGRYGRYY